MTLRQRTHIKKDLLPQNRSRFFSIFTGKKVATQQTPKFETLGGVYSSMDGESQQNKSCHSLSTVDTSASKDRYDESSSTSCSSHSPINDWTSSGSPQHHKGSPLVVRRPPSQRSLGYNYPTEGNGLGDASTLGLVMSRSRKLPQHSDMFANNHVMVNAERVKRLVQPLVRIPTLDQLAREHASSMANVGHLFYANMSDLNEITGKVTTHRLGHNVVRGATVQSMHDAMMGRLADKNNMLDRRFTCMGMGTAKSADGTLYLCQIFRG